MSSQAPDIGHTPGPWFWNDRDQLVGEEWAEPCYPDEPARREVIVETDGGHYAPHGADRHLIAAAPDLLEACTQAEWNSLDLPSFVVEILRAAIAKATKGDQ